MNEHALYELLAVLSDAAGLTQPPEFTHLFSGCQGQPTDYGSHWQCHTCSALQHKHNYGGGYETQRLPSPQGRSFVHARLGPPHQPPPAVAPLFIPPTQEEAMQAEMKRALREQVKEMTPLEHIDADLRKYTDKA